MLPDSCAARGASDSAETVFDESSESPAGDCWLAADGRTAPHDNTTPTSATRAKARRRLRIVQWGRFSARTVKTSSEISASTSRFVILLIVLWPVWRFSMVASSAIR